MQDGFDEIEDKRLNTVGMETVELEEVLAGAASRGVEALCQALRETVRKRPGGYTAVARKAGLSRPGLYKAIGENGNPSYATIERILAALGVEKGFANGLSVRAVAPATPGIIMDRNTTTYSVAVPEQKYLRASALELFAECDAVDRTPSDFIDGEKAAIAAAIAQKHRRKGVHI